MTHTVSMLSVALAGFCTLAVSAPASALAQDRPQAAFMMTAPAQTAATAEAPAGMLAALPGGAEQLTFSGESGDRQFAVYVLPMETTKAASLVLSYQSTVSIMPESSRMQIFVNDLPVGETKLGSGSGETLSIDLAPGTLQPGFNQVRIVVNQHHRVDCSIAGTYELWTAIDPSRSGFAFEGGASRIEGLEDLPALARFGDDGRIRIRATLPGGKAAKDVGRATRIVQSAILMGSFDGAAVDFGPAGNEAALEIVSGTLATLPDAKSDWLVGNTEFPGVTFEPGTGTTAAKLIVAGTTEAELDRAVMNLAKASERHAPAGTPVGLRALLELKGRPLKSGQVATLRELGMSSTQFAGRFYRAQASFQLPADFYPADYADGTFALNALYAAGLNRDAQLVIRANDRVVSTIPLNSSKQGLIEKQRLRVPLGALQPGRNILSFEANLPNESDVACDPAVQANPAGRLLISDTSSLTIPNFARVGHVPDLASMTSGGAGPEGGARSRDLSVMTQSLDLARLSVAATFVGKMASSSGINFDAHFLTAMPEAGNVNLIAFGTFADLPPELLAQVRVTSPEQSFGEIDDETGLLVGSAKASEIGTVETLDVGLDALASVPTADDASVAGFQDFMSSFTATETIGERLRQLGSQAADAAFSLLGLGRGLLGDDADPKTFFRPQRDATLLIAQGPAPLSSGAAWTVVASSDVAALETGVARLISTSRWDQIGGAVSTMRGDAGTMHSVAAENEHLFETQPRTLANIRLVVAGWFSRHLESYVLGLLLSCLLLGTTTFLFLRSVGERRQ